MDGPGSLGDALRRDALAGGGAARGRPSTGMPEAMAPGVGAELFRSIHGLSFYYPRPTAGFSDAAVDDQEGLVRALPGAGHRDAAGGAAGTRGGAGRVAHARRQLSGWR